MRASLKRLVLSMTLAAVVTTASAGVASATICFPPGFGVPGASGVPAWWGGASSNGLGDPRWRGAAMFNHVGDQARFQVVVDNSGANKYLVMMWSVNADLTADDLLYFGFYNDGGTPASSTGNIFRIKRKNNAAIQDAGTPDGGAASSSATTDLEAFYWNNAAGTPAWQVVSGIAHFPTWIGDDTRLDVKCGSSGCDTWDIRLRVKLVGSGQGNFGNPNAATGAGLELGSTFKLWYEIKTVLGDLSSPTSSLEFNSAVTATDPDLTDPTNFADENALGGPRFPDTSKWMTASVDTTLSTCEKGINISGGDISVVNSVTGPGGGSQISLLGANTFHAKPWNNTGAGVAGTGLLAKFRIADWNTSSHASAIWRTINPSCDGATGSGASAGTISNGSQFDLNTCTWTLSASERCDYAVPTGRPDSCPPATKDDHQCVLVELRTASSQYYFSSSSAYRNHDFVGASEFRRKVRVDVNGLPNAGLGANRDVYVYLQTKNMPAHVTQPPPAGDKGNDQPRDVSPALRKRLQLPDDGHIGTEESARIQAALGAGQLTWDEVSQLMPTHVAYAWHDTGKTIKVDGVERKLLRPQAPFGFFVSHDGKLTGWENKLEGATVTLLSPNFYKIAVPTNGFVNAETVIRALGEPPVPPGGCDQASQLPWWVWVLILLVLIVIVALARRRGGTSP
jgi:hypothetical protein